MTCEELVKHLSSYLDQELDVELALAAQEHLATCRNCQVVVNTTRGAILLGRGERQRTIPAATRQQLFTGIMQALARNDQEKRQGDEGIRR